MKASRGKPIDPNVTPNAEYERTIIDLFMAPERRERLHLYRERQREHLVSSLHTTKFLDMSIATSVTVRPGDVSSVLPEMKRRGATSDCYVISALRDLDARVLPLERVLREVVGFSVETILFCPGTRVAYWEGGGYTPHLILYRREGHEA